MTTFKLYSILIFLIGFFACTTKAHQTSVKTFTIITKSLKADTVITSAVYFSAHIICLQADHKIFVVDTSLNEDKNLTAKFESVKADFLLPFNDTIFIGTDKGIHFLEKDFSLKLYNLQPFKYGLPYYNDDTYYVHACSAGEWGGAVFFWNRKTNKTYSYPATDVQQVFKFDNTYVVSNFLAHMSGISDYLFIKDPTQLYELKSEQQKTFCNWYMSVDSIKGTKLFDTITPQGVKYYSDTFTTRTLTTFPYKNELYSIYCTDSATILAKFKNSRLVPIDTLLKQELTFQEAKTHLTEENIVTAYEAVWAMGDIHRMIDHQNSGLIYIHNKQITFLEFQTPHMWTENYGR
jgi:hypothetical protein